MTLLKLLLFKDLRRAARNPVPLLILILIPTLITALIGLAFGNFGGNQNSFAPIRLGIVDEDNSLFTRVLNGAASREEFREYIDAQFLEREVAMDMVSNGELSALLIIPEKFTERYLNGEYPVQLTLIKNPAEYIYPTIAQEGSDLIVTFLNTVARNLRDDLKDIAGLIAEDREFDLLRDIVTVNEVMNRAADRMEAAEDYLTPPLITYHKREEAENTDEKSSSDQSRNGIFSYLLIGMAAMFLLMSADTSMRDLYRESRFRTLERFRTLQENLFGFVASKVIYTVIILLIVSLILLGGGSIVFRFRWEHVDKLIILVFAYSIFAAGLMGFIAALAGKERRADFLNNMLVIGMSLAGGCMWPPQNLPSFIRENITPVCPPYWFSSAVRQLQSQDSGFHWQFSTILLLGLGVLLIAASAWLFQKRLEGGIKE